MIVAYAMGNCQLLEAEVVFGRANGTRFMPKWKTVLRRIALALLCLLTLLAGYAVWICWETPDITMRLFAFAYATMGLGCMGVIYKIVSPTLPPKQTPPPAQPPEGSAS